MLGPHTHTPAPAARGWPTPKARPVGGQSGEGQRLTPDAPHNGGRQPPPGTAFRHPHSKQHWPARAHAVGPVLGPHARTDRDTRVAEPWLPTPEDAWPGEGQRLTPGAHHNGPPPPPRHAAPTGHAGQRCKVGPPHPHTRAHSTWVADPNNPPQWAGSRGRDSAWPQTPLTMAEGNPPGDALPPPPQRATPARKGARCGTCAGSPRPHRPHPGHTGRGTLAARSGGQAAGGGTAPDSRRPSQRWQATYPGDSPPPTPRHTAPTGHAGQGDSVGPPHPHTRAHSTWVADPPGTPFRHPHSEQRRPASARAVGPVLGPHARNDHTRDTRVAKPRLPAPGDGRPGEGQCLTPNAPRNDGRQPPRGRPSATPTTSNAPPHQRTSHGTPHPTPCS